MAPSQWSPPPWRGVTAPADAGLPPDYAVVGQVSAGQDTIDKGLTAIYISMCVVPLFMILYYHVAGVVAVETLGRRVYLCAFTSAEGHAWLALDGDAHLRAAAFEVVDALAAPHALLCPGFERGDRLALAPSEPDEQHHQCRAEA